jgi:SAM-dependent methyltransferase
MKLMQFTRLASTARYSGKMGDSSQAVTGSRGSFGAYNALQNPLYNRRSSLKATHALLSLIAECRCRIFDWRHHIDTCGFVGLADLTVTGENAEHGAAYQPTHPKFVFEILRDLGIDYRRYAFVDIGSGKGRTLFVAAEYPFGRIIGVEFAKELHNIALRNARNFRSRTQKCHDIECVLVDASQYAFPPMPTVFFMFNPFRPPVLTPVLRRLNQSLIQAPRDVILIYVGAFHAHLIESETKMRQMQEGPHHKMFRFTPD